MNTELMSLYRERGVNPASGCVPMLLTLPVLFAFYSMLSVAIELRGAPFVGMDSRPVGLRSAVRHADAHGHHAVRPDEDDADDRGPVQQKMIMFMPLIFMSMFLWAPSGLVLYWTASNFWAIGQQVLTNRLIGPAKPQQRAAAGRAAREECRRREEPTRHQGAEVMELHERVREFTQQTVAAMGVPLDSHHRRAGDNIRMELSGEGGEVLLRRRAEALDALQQIVNTAFRRELNDDRSFVVDCMDYRKAKDAELRQMARFMMERRRSAGPQEIGPLNPYARRLVHLAVAEDPQLSSESIGDAFLKTVIISVRR